MALTRKFLAALEIDAAKIDQIIDAHTETVDALKDQLNDAKKGAGDLAKVQKELDDLKQEVKDKYKSKEDYDKLKKEYDDYKADVSGKEAAAAKEKAVRAYFESKGIKGTNLDIAIRGAKDEISAVELDGDKIKDAKALDALIAGTFKGLVSSVSTQGANTANPPQNGGTGNEILTKADILKMRDASARQKAIQEHPDLFKSTIVG